MFNGRRLSAILATSTWLCSGCHSSSNGPSLARSDVSYIQYDLEMVQELINDAPLGPGEHQPSTHCPQTPGTWFSGSGRSTAVSNIFGRLSEVEVYCINADRGELSGGIATWTDSAGDEISMYFGAKLLEGFAYNPAPSAPIIGFAHFTGGTGKWSGLTGDAFITGNQNGDGTATLTYKGTLYLPE